jgi:hypothetical protein
MEEVSPLLACVTVRRYALSPATPSHGCKPLRLCDEVYPEKLHSWEGTWSTILLHQHRCSRADMWMLRVLRALLDLE